MHSDIRRSRLSRGRPTTRRAAARPQGGMRRASSARRMPNAAVRRFRRQVLFTLYAALAGVLVAALFTTPLLHVRSVQIRGTAGLPAAERAEVIQAARIPARTNFLLAPINRVQASVRALPWVRAATVHRQFPNGITVDLSQRQTEAIVQTTAGNWEVDHEGRPIRIAAAGAAQTLPLIVWHPPASIHSGLILGDHALQSALDLAFWAQKETAIRFAKIEVDQRDNICLNMKDGIPIIFGPDTEMARKQAIVTTLYRREPDIAGRVQQIDISCPTDVACIPRVVLPTAPASVHPTTGATVVNRP